MSTLISSHLRTPEKIVTYYLYITKRNTFCNLSELLQTGDILADDVELQVDNTAHADILEVGVSKGVGDDRHLERVAGGPTDGERHTVDGHRALVYGEVAVERHLSIFLILKGEVRTSVGIFHGCAGSCLVDVSLHDVAVQSAVHHHRPLHVHLVAHVEQSQVRAVERLLHRRDDVLVAVDADHGEADAVVCHALVDLQFARERALQGEINVFPVFPNSYYGSKFFNNT